MGAFAIVELASLTNLVAAAAVKVIPGKLGYQEVSKFPQKRCENCKNYRAETGECVLLAMKNVMKAEHVLVDRDGHCNMWAKI